MRELLRSAGFLVGVVWVACTMVALMSPDLVSGSQHEHIPLATLTVWLWALVATGYVLMGTRQRVTPGFAVGVILVWAAVAVTAALAPVMVTGTDPTEIPLAAVLAPVFGTLGTGFLALHNANTFQVLADGD